MRKFISLTLIFCITLLSCNKEEITSIENTIINTKIAPTLKISPDNDIITSEEAANVATIMNIANKNYTKGNNTREVDNVICLYDSNNNPAIYAVNYKDNQGYTLISATKDYFPILANVYEGSYNNYYNSPENILIDEYKMAIANSKLMPTDSISKIRKIWSIYENNSYQTLSTTKLTEFETFVTNQLQEWNSNIDIHAFYNLNEAYGMVPSDVYNYFCSIAQGLAHPEYDYMTYSYIVETVDRQIVDPNNYLLKTTWLQTIPYNLSAPVVNEIHPLLGCTAVALGQIMKFHKCPNTYIWDNMPNSLSPFNTTRTELSDFLYEIADEIKLSNAPLNYSNIDNCYNALVNKYGYSGSIDIHNKQRAINSIVSRKPVFMSGQSNADNDGDGVREGHAWVCDGFEVSKLQIVYTLYVIETSHTLNYIQHPNPILGEIITEGHYFHMNWALSETPNGWYLEGPNATNSINYPNNRENIYNIFPNASNN